MKIVIFAGGVGTRLWPLSRKNTPKQFEKIVGDKSTLQLTVDRVKALISPEDIFISSGVKYQEIIKTQLPFLPEENIILEPEMRDVGAAVGLITAILAKISPDEPFIILWSDHIVKNQETFETVIKTVEKVLLEEKNKIVFIGQQSRFASQNLGWIESGEELKQIDNVPVFEFKSFHYRPEPKLAVEFHASQAHTWNPGYFGTTAGFLFTLFKKFAPDMAEGLEKIQSAWGTEDFEKVLSETYPTLEENSFDNLILEKMDPENGYVLSSDLGWSDIGAWESLKEALQETDDENVTRGNVMLEDSTDTLAFNYTNQLVVGIDLEKYIVVNTNDVLLICPKDSVPKVKTLVKSLAGTKNDNLA